MNEIDRLLAQAGYAHKEDASSRTKTLLHAFKGLQPSVKPYVFNNGFTSDLVCISGTIPVLYMGSTYYIPVDIWLLPKFPYEAPLVFVRPTEQMIINPSEAVDPSGFVTLQYLKDWSFSRSDLYTLVQIMQHNFAEKPPVYSKPVNAVNSTRASIPTNGTRTLNTTEPISMNSATPHSASSSSWSPSPSRPSSSVSASGLAASAHLRLPPIGMQAVHQPQPEPQLPYPIFPAGPYPVLPVAQSSRPNSGVSSTPRRLSPLASPRPGSGSSSAFVAIQSATSDTDHFKSSLISSLLHKANRILSERLSGISVEIESLQATLSELSHNAALLDDMIYRLDQENYQSTSAFEQLHSRTKQLEELSMSDHQVQTDEIIAPTAPVYKQLTEAYAEEQALEDAMHYLDGALQQEVITLDAYGKHIRHVARKQFYAKLTVRKCREKAGLPVP